MLEIARHELGDEKVRRRLGDHGLDLDHVRVVELEAELYLREELYDVILLDALT